MSDTENKPHSKAEDSIAEQNKTEEHRGSPRPPRAPVESPPAPPKVQGGSTENKNNLQKWLERIPPDLSRWVSVAALVVSLGSCYGSYRAANIAKMALIVNQRPAVHLGLPDGKIAAFVSVGEEEKIALYFRNYGQSTARLTIVETWPIIIDARDGAVSGVKVPPPEEAETGPDLPPGFPYTYYQPVPEVSQAALAKGEKNLFIVGRVRYADSFTQYCDVFTIRYTRGLASEFALHMGHTVGSFDPCVRNAAYILSIVTTTGKKEDITVQGKQEKEEK